MKPIEVKILKDIDKEPTPDFSGINIEDYKYKYMPYSTTRGCYNNCFYCYDKVFWIKYRFKSADKIYKDIKRLTNKHKINKIMFSDSNILGPKNNIINFCDRIINNNLDIRWYGQLSLHTLDESTIKKMKKAGCFELSAGIESGSQKVIDSMNKKISLKEIEDLMRIIRRNKIKFLACFMVGYPTETWQDYFKTVKFILKNKRDLKHVFCNLTSIYEGTEVYNNAERYGIKDKDSYFWSSKGNNLLTRFLRYTIMITIIKIFIKKKRWI